MAENKEEAAAAEVTAEAAPIDDGGGSATSEKKPLVTILLILNTLIILGIGFMQFQAHKKIASQPSIEDVVKAEMEHAKVGDIKKDENEVKEKNDGTNIQMDPFTANLAQSDGPRRFIRMNIVLKFNKEAQPAEIEARKPQMRDTIINILNTKKADDLLKKEGKYYLKEEIKGAINSYMIDGQVIDMYYVSFQIQ
ncbi:MAG: flagellar basal body-associated FliL family protein [Bacteriovoracaceae bacterium]